MNSYEEREETGTVDDFLVFARSEDTKACADDTLRSIGYDTQVQLPFGKEPYDSYKSSIRRTVNRLLRTATK